MATKRTTTTAKVAGDPVATGERKQRNADDPCGYCIANQHDQCHPELVTTAGLTLLCGCRKCWPLGVDGDQEPLDKKKKVE